MRYWKVNLRESRLELWETSESGQFGYALVRTGTIDIAALDGRTEAEIQRYAIDRFGIPLPPEYVHA